MATEVVKIVDPNNGTGTHYTSLAAWESGEQRDLVSADEIAVAKCRCTGGTADNYPVVIDGWTTDSTRYIKIWTDPSEGYRHNGTFPTSGNKYRLVTNYPNTFIIEVKTNYARIDGIPAAFSDGNTWRVCIGSKSGYITGSSDIRISNCVVAILSGTSVYSSGIESAPNGSSQVFTVWNCIAYNFTGSTSSYHRGFHSQNGANNGVYNIYNCTAYNCGRGYSNDSGSSISFTAVNCGAANCTTGFTSYISQTTCSTSTPSFVNASGGDFHLASTDTAWKDQGTSDPGYGLFSDDIDGETRSGTWDIGADEYVSAGGSALPVFMRTYRARRL